MQEAQTSSEKAGQKKSWSLLPILFRNSIVDKAHCKNHSKKQLSWNQTCTIIDKSPWDSDAIFIFFCHSGFPHQTVLPFRNFFCISLLPLLPQPHTKFRLRKNSGCTCPTLFVGEGRGWACVNWKTRQKCKSVPRLLSMRVVLFGYSTVPYYTIHWVSFHNGSRNLDCYPWLYYFIVSVTKFNMLHSPRLFALCYHVGLHTCLPASLKSVSGFSNGIFDGDGTSFHHQTPNLESQVL